MSRGRWYLTEKTSKSRKTWKNKFTKTKTWTNSSNYKIRREIARIANEPNSAHSFIAAYRLLFLTHANKSLCCSFSIEARFTLFQKWKNSLDYVWFSSWNLENAIINITLLKRIRERTVFQEFDEFGLAISVGSLLFCNYFNWEKNKIFCLLSTSLGWMPYCSPISLLLCNNNWTLC